MQIIDLIIIAVFLIITFILGIKERKKITIDDYWVNNRRTNKFVLIATIVSTFIGAGAILGAAGITFSGGGLAMFLIVGSSFFYFLIFSKFLAPKIKEFGDSYQAYSLPDFFAHRYSNKVRIMGAIIVLVSQILFLALQILAIGVFVQAVTGFHPNIATIIGSLIVIIYTAIGGLRADIRTDIFQFFVMLSLLLIFLPIIIIKAGGFSVISTLPKSFITGAGFAPFYVIILAFLFLGTGSLSSPELWQRSYSADSVKNVKWSMRISSVIIFFFLAMAVLFGIYGKILIPEGTSNTIVPELLKSTIPTGLFGIIIAGFFAAVMSSSDSLLLISSMTLVHDIYQKTFKKEISKEKILKISRWTTFILGIIALIVALIVFNIVHLTIEAVTFYVVLLPSIIFGFYWKRASTNAAFWSILLGFSATLIFIFIDPIQAFIPGLMVSLISFVAITLFKKHTTN